MIDIKKQNFELELIYFEEQEQKNVLRIDRVKE